MKEKRVRFPDVMFEALEKEAAQRDMTDSELILHYVRRCLNQDKWNLPPTREMRAKEEFRGPRIRQEGAESKEDPMRYPAGAKIDGVSEV
jgi:hypothetical protein